MRHHKGHLKGLRSDRNHYICEAFCFNCTYFVHVEFLILKKHNVLITKKSKKLSFLSMHQTSISMSCIVVEYLLYDPYGGFIHSFPLSLRNGLLLFATMCT